VAGEQIERRLVAILIADVAGYSRLIGIDDEGTLAQLNAHHAELIEPKIKEHRGRIVRTTGDGLLVLFVSAVDALRCAVEIQRAMVQRNAQVPPDRRIEFRMGVNVGDIVEGASIHGDGINVAARLEALAEAGGVCVSSRVQEDAKGSLGRLGVAFEDLGQHQLKNIDHAVQIYRVLLGHVATTVKSKQTPTPAPALPERPSIAVLPFANMSGDPEQEYFADGMVDDILMALSRVRWLFVIARQSSFIYKIRSADVKQIGRELGVRYVVEGSVRKSGTRVRIVAQLIETETGAHIWADRYEGDLRDIFALQDEITERIVSAIEPTVRTVEIKRALAKPTGSLTAYDCYLRALPYYYSQTREAVLRAETLLQEAIDLDPGYAEALGTLADCIAIRTSTGWHESRRRGTDQACEAARLALAAGPDNSTCVASAAFAYGILGHRFDEALELAERAIQLHPNSTFVRNRAGAVYSVSGESDKAVAQFEAAQRMNPLDNKTATVTFTVATTAHFFASRFEESVRWGKRTMAITPDANVARWIAAAALGHLGRLDEARVEIDKILALHPIATLARARRASFRYDWMYDLYLDGLRKAGLPEA
jgi:adenylate cyclase